MLTITPCTKNDLPLFRRLYLTAFPQEERAPWWLLKRRASQHRAEALEALDDGKFAGLAYVVTLDDMAYLFYLAVAEEQRGQGTGGRIIAALRERYPDKRLFLAREQLDPAAENYPQRESRHQFYLNNGFEDWGTLIKEGPVTYDVMGIGKSVTPPEYKALMTSWTGKLAGLMFRAYLTENK